MATFDSKTILMMAENGHSVEIDGKKIQMTIVQEAVEAKPDYSHLVGKWVKCLDSFDEDSFTIGKWYKCISNPAKTRAFLDNEMRANGFAYESANENPKYFDLSNPLDHNPDEVRVFDVPSEIKILHGSLGLLLEFSAHQALWYCKEKHCYGVRLHDTPQPLIPCIATECKFDDLQEGDLFFATDDEKPHFTRLRMYNFLNKDGGFVWTDGAAVNVLVGHKYTHYFKITPKP